MLQYQQQNNVPRQTVWLYAEGQEVFTEGNHVTKRVMEAEEPQ